MSNEEWWQKNRQAVSRRMAWLKEMPEGTIWETRSGLHRIIVHRDNGIVRMYFGDPRSAEEGLSWSGAMSAVKLDDPFDLSPTPYNQAMMLALLWQPAPERVYVAGFAGGRIPLMFHHYFPNVVIESTDIDPEVVEIGRRFFGIEYDGRQRLFIQDGRRFLEAHDPASPYDFVYVDVFRGMGFSPPHFATSDFYELCKRHLKPGGVVAVNMVESDPLFGRRVSTIASCFEHTYVQLDRTIVLFGTDADVLRPEDVVSRAAALQAEYRFSFPFVERAATLRPLPEIDTLRRLPETHTVLKDSARVAESFPMAPDDPLFYRVGRNDACPCGSGKKFKKCHGR